jgi:hypothetical protein
MRILYDCTPRERSKLVCHPERSEGSMATITILQSNGDSHEFFAPLRTTGFQQIWKHSLAVRPSLFGQLPEEIISFRVIALSFISPRMQFHPDTLPAPLVKTLFSDSFRASETLLHLTAEDGVVNCEHATKAKAYFTWGYAFKSGTNYPKSIKLTFPQT